MGFGALTGIIVFILGILFIIKFEINVLGLSILILGLSPFYLGLDVKGGIPKIFLDQVIYLLYIPYFVFIYFILKKKQFATGGLMLSISIILFLVFQSISFIVNPTFYVAIRNFLETFVFGGILFYIFYNEVDDSSIETIINFIVLVTVSLSIIIIIEAIAKQNPVLEKVTDFQFISPQLAARAGGVYRPYAVFFNPSEAGTFIAMGIPFILYKAKNIKFFYSLFIFATTIAAVIFNYTRGVWFALLFNLLLFSSFIRRTLLILSPVIILSGIVLYAALNDHPFIQRLADPENLLIRFFYWNLAVLIFEQNKMFGIGHMNFKETYLSFVSEGVETNIGFDISDVFVADNMLITTVIEHGLLGFFALSLLFFVIFYKLLKHYFILKNKDDKKNSLLLKACIISISIYLSAGLLVDVHLFTKATKYFFIIVGIGMSIIKTRDIPDTTKSIRNNDNKTD